MPMVAKKTKQAVDYTPTAMVRGERCELCRHFVAGGKCRKVRGKISPNGWCELFKRKA